MKIMVVYKYRFNTLKYLWEVFEMKKFISVFLSLAMVLTMFATTPLTASAETYTTTIDGIKYEIDPIKGEA